MEVICIQEPAFYALIDKVVSHIKATQSTATEKWVTGDEAMKMLNITSKTTLQKFRDDGKIRFTQPEKKIILYDAHSITEFLNKHVR